MIDLILFGVQREKMQETFIAGIKAYVWLYYQNYTDAMELEQEAIRLIARAIDILDLGVEVEDVVREAEREINEAGGIRSDSDGRVHKVQTYPTDLTREQAEQVLALVKQKHKAYLVDCTDDDQPILFAPGTWGDTQAWVISWESGPYEWAYRFPEGGLNEGLYGDAIDAGATPAQAEQIASEGETKLPDGIWVEPYYTFALCLYLDSEG